MYLDSRLSELNADLDNKWQMSNVLQHSSLFIFTIFSKFDFRKGFSEEPDILKPLEHFRSPSSQTAAEARPDLWCPGWPRPRPGPASADFNIKVGNVIRIACDIT